MSKAGWDIDGPYVVQTWLACYGSRFIPLYMYITLSVVEGDWLGTTVLPNH